MRLIEVARDESHGTWSMLWRSRIRSLCMGVGFGAVTLALVESVGHVSVLTVGGMLCLLAAYAFGPATDRRLDALVRVLDRNGTLRAGSDDKREQPA